MRRAEWIWAFVLVVLLAVGYRLVPLPEASEPGDSFSEDAGGKKAFYLLASELLEDVGRSSEALVPPDVDTDVLVLLGPARYPDRAQWETLHDWVAEGRALVFAARWGDPAVDLPPFGIRIVPEASPFDAGERIETDEDEPEATSDGLSNRLGITGDFEWRSQGRIEHSFENAEVQLERGGTTQVLWQMVGNGVIVVAASDHVFSNRSLTRDDNGLLAFRILEAASPAGPVRFDETLNQAGAPRVVGVLFEDPFRLPATQLLLVALLYVWRSSRRFGPVASRSAPARRSLVEHATALGSLHFRVGSGPTLIASYLEFFRRELGLGWTRDAGGGGRRTEVRTESARPEVAHALRAAKSPELDRGRVGEIVAALARARATSRGSPRHMEKESR